MRHLLGSLAAFAALLAACSGSSSPPPQPEPGAGPDAPGAAPPDGDFGKAGENPGADPACAKATYVASRAPLALGVMLDRSDSMLATTSAGVTKWSAAKAALDAFFAASESQALDVGLYYFPKRAAGVPTSCTSSFQCGAHGPCGFKLCLMPGDPKECESPADCGGSPCELVGKCSLADKLCLAGSASPCGPGEGSCRLWCTRETACEVADYATPAVPVGPVKTNRGAIASSLASIAPWGNTPTAPALGGVLSATEGYAASHPGHAAAVVFVTDGLPTDCGVTDMSAIGALADLGLGRGVRTFVVGVFAPDEAADAQANLDTLAKAGGTGAAIIVSTSANVTSALTSALGDVRERAASCAYALPQPKAGDVVDPKRVNVVATPAGLAPSTVPQVGSASACGADAGWHYDDPKAPAKIVLCPRTCEAIARSEGSKLDVVTGCQTVVR